MVVQRIFLIFGVIEGVPDRAVTVRQLWPGLLLRSWAIHFTFKVRPLSTQADSYPIQLPI